MYIANKWKGVTMEQYIEILKEIGSVKCKKCDGICLLDYYRYCFVCKNCGTEYIFEERDI